jgi:hypothetical protein
MVLKVCFSVIGVAVLSVLLLYFAVTGKCQRGWQVDELLYAKSKRRKSHALWRYIVALTFICIMVDMVDQAFSVSVGNFTRGSFVTHF